MASSADNDRSECHPSHPGDLPHSAMPFVIVEPEYHHSSSTSHGMASDKLHPLTPIYGRSSDLDFTAPTVSAPNSPGLRSFSATSLQPHATPSRTPPTGPRLQRARGTSQSRSSSMPNALRINEPISHVKSPLSSGRSTPPQDSKSSVKHLTCFWWKEKGHCKHPEPQCLYAHYDTGRYADPPRTLIPGQPALAGRSLDRALRSIHNRSTSSLASSSISQPPTPAPFDHPRYGYGDSQTTLVSDKDFTRNLTEQSSREKSILLTTIESLQSENKELKSKVYAIKSERDQLTTERDLLRGVVSQMQRQTRQVGNPYGVIGGEIPSSNFNDVRNGNDDSSMNIRHSFGF